MRLRAGLQEGLRGQSEAALWSTGGCFGLTSGSWDFFFSPQRASCLWRVASLYFLEEH